MALGDDLSKFAGALARVTYDKAELRSNLWPRPIVVDLAAQVEDATPGLVSRLVGLQVTVRGPAGQIVSADPPRYPWLGLAAAGGAVLVLLGLGYAVGRATT